MFLAIVYMVSTNNARQTELNKLLADQEDPTPSARTRMTLTSIAAAAVYQEAQILNRMLNN